MALRAPLLYLASHTCAGSSSSKGSGELRMPPVITSMCRPRNFGQYFLQELTKPTPTVVVPGTVDDDARLLQGGIRQAIQQGRIEETTIGGRRGLMVSSMILSTISALLRSTIAEAAAQDTESGIPLELYSDAKNGFKFLRPAPWNKVDKPGASVFFEDPNSRSNNIGVTVAPVRIASLDAFGTVDDVVEKLVKAERDKPSTKDMQVVNVLEKRLKNQTALYSVEYTLDTSRGSKRVLTSVTVAAYKLYILSIVFVDGPTPASDLLHEALNQVLDSFELVA